jgi:hypothetical protein
VRPVLGYDTTKTCTASSSALDSLPGEVAGMVGGCILLVIDVQNCFRVLIALHKLRSSHSPGQGSQSTGHRTLTGSAAHVHGEQQRPVGTVQQASCFTIPAGVLSRTATRAP